MAELNEREKQERRETSMSRRTITTEVTEEDKRIEGSLRPQTLDEYIGQGADQIDVKGIYPCGEIPRRGA